MVTREENDRMTRIGPGTPAGALLRRYWQAVCPLAEVTADKPVKRVRILGENLVLYRDTTGRLGLVGERCPHRHASLAFGRVDDTGLACPYHGWKFNGQGQCIATPAEDARSPIKDEVRIPGYPVQSVGGMVFAYMGPLPAPALPRWDVLAWEQGRRWITSYEPLNCNWLQCMENSVDPSHLYLLHGASAHLAPILDHYEEQHDFIVYEYGIMKRRTTPAKDGKGTETDQHPLLFPNALRHVAHNRQTKQLRHNLQFRIPIDDTHTQVVVVNFEPNASDRSPADSVVPVTYLEYRVGEDGYDMSMVPAQDFMAWETQGPIMDRTEEYLGASDRGVVTLRRLLRDQIDIVEKGGTPTGILPAGSQPAVIELEVINERIGLVKPDTQSAA